MYSICLLGQGERALFTVVWVQKLTLNQDHRNLFYPELAAWRDGEVMAKSGSIPWREIDLLKKGATLLKYSKSGAPRSRSVALSEDMRNVRWVSKNKKEKNSEGR